VLAPAAERFALVDEIAALQNPWFSIQYGPVGPQWVTDATLRRIAEDSARTGRRVHMHAFETRLQREWADAAYPNGYFAYLDEIGLLSPRLTLAHAVWLTQPEAELLAQRGVTVSLNASSNLRLRSGVPPVALCLNAKLRFGIGLDGMAIDDDEDMLREIRLLRHLANGASPGLEGSGLTDAHLFDAALAVGRHSILGADGGGAIDVGAPADMLVLDFAAMTSDCLAAEPDPLPVLLTRMARRHVQQLMVAGRMIVDGGTCRSVDLPALQAELLAQARHVRAADGTDEATRTRLRTAIRAYYGCVCRPAAMGATHGA
jgi:cytosine/adenosine deaminase-related metal-dependent hydrolase